MTGLHRTPQGQISTRLFLNVDILLYTEGRTGSRIKQHDELFWETTASSIFGTSNVAAISLGSKLDVIEQHRNAAASVGAFEGNVFYCVDSDYSLLDSSPDLVGLARTWGYSFENELCELDFALSYIDENVSGPARSTISNEIHAQWPRVQARVSSCGRACIYLKIEHNSVYGKERVATSLGCSVWSKSEIYLEYKDKAKQSPTHLATVEDLRGLRQLFGLLVPGGAALNFIYRVVSGSITRHGHRAPSYEQYVKYCLRARERSLFVSTEIKEHYIYQFRKN